MRTLFLIIALSFAINSLFSQTNYYTETKTFYEDGYTYQVDRCESGNIKVYNKDNKWINKDQTYKSTGEYFEVPDYGPDLLDNRYYRTTNKILYDILYECFSDEEIENIKNIGRICIINFYIDSETGKVDDVRFSFDRISGYVNIPISVFREIELKIKDRLTFVVTEEGKKINYIFCFEVIYPTDFK